MFSPSGDDCVLSDPSVAVMYRRSMFVMITAGFGIEQDRGDDRLHVSARTRAGIVGIKTRTVVIESLCHAIDVGRTRIAGHQVLNELFSDKRSDVWIIENIVERGVQISQRVLTCRQHGSVEQRL